MSEDTISRRAAIDALMNSELGSWNNDDYERGARAQHLDDVAAIKSVPSVRKKRKPSAQTERLKKIADLVDGTIDHFDRDDAMDLLYQIKEVLKNG